MNFKEATNFALIMIRDVYGEEAKDFRLEEIFVPQPPRKPNWVITIGFSVPETNPMLNQLAAAFQGGQKRFERVYKRVTIGADDQLISIENRIIV